MLKDFFSNKSTPIYLLGDYLRFNRGSLYIDGQVIGIQWVKPKWFYCIGCPDHGGYWVAQDELKPLAEAQ